MTTGQWLGSASLQLKNAGLTSAQLDAEVLLSDALQKSRAWLLAHNDYMITIAEQAKLFSVLERRKKREPLAYIRGQQEFFRRGFLVTPAVLVPRPETETLVELLKELSPRGKLQDVGTGSGAIAITAKLEFPALVVFASDISAEALVIASKNAKRLGADITFYQQDLLNGEKNGPFSFITANLPYVGQHWERSTETDFEPSKALFAPDNGLMFIKRLLMQARDYLTPQGSILLEADPRQHGAIISFAKKQDYSLLRKQDFIIVLQKTTG